MHWYSYWAEWLLIIVFFFRIINTVEHKPRDDRTSHFLAEVIFLVLIASAGAFNDLFNYLTRGV